MTALDKQNDRAYRHAPKVADSADKTAGQTGCENGAPRPFRGPVIPPGYQHAADTITAAMLDRNQLVALVDDLIVAGVDWATIRVEVVELTYCAGRPSVDGLRSVYELHGGTLTAHDDRRQAKGRKVNCLWCGAEFVARRSNAQACPLGNCKSSISRARRLQVQSGGSLGEVITRLKGSRRGGQTPAQRAQASRKAKAARRAEQRQTRGADR